MSDGTEVRAVIFDFGNVLCFPPSDEKLDRAAAECGLTREQFWEAFWFPRLDYDAGKVEPDFYWWAVLSAAGKPFDEEKLPALIRHEVEFWNEFDHRMLAWVDQLRAAGCKTAMLSNLPRVLGEALRETGGLYDRFDHVTLSYELKTTKPDAAIYQDAVNGLGVAPRETLFLDDKAPNVEGAQKAGLQAELFTTAEEFVSGKVAEKYGLRALSL